MSKKKISLGKCIALGIIALVILYFLIAGIKKIAMTAIILLFLGAVSFVVYKRYKKNK